jgi:glutathione S-transferase
MLRDGSKTIADSEFIQRYLSEEKAIDFDSHLSLREKGQAHAFAKMIEERTYWTLVYDRWLNDDNWPYVAKYWFGDMPFPLGALISRIARKGVRKNINGHGIGLHTPEEIELLAKSDLDAIAAQLGDQDFLFGDKPSSADATAFGLLINCDRGQLPSNMKATLQAYPTLVSYVARGLKRWFPEVTTEVQAGE